MLLADSVEISIIIEPQVWWLKEKGEKQRKSSILKHYFLAVQSSPRDSPLFSPVPFPHLLGKAGTPLVFLGLGFPSPACFCARSEAGFPKWVEGRVGSIDIHSAAP